MRSGRRGSWLVGEGRRSALLNGPCCMECMNLSQDALTWVDTRRLGMLLYVCECSNNECPTKVRS